MSELGKLREVIFNMLNFTNMYCLVLDQEMVVKFVNTSLAMDLGYEKYQDLIDRCWLDYTPVEDRKLLTTVHHSIANGMNNWEDKYREVVNDIKTKDGKLLKVHWFNSHINSDTNWTFSFGIKRLENINSPDDMRNFYYEIIQKDRVAINTMRDALGLRDEIVDTCKPNFIEETRTVG